MKKIIYSAAFLAAMGFVSNAKAQLIDETNVTITMDLQPILQLSMNGPQNIDFVFDQISKYASGITQYGATNLSVSSTVNWDLYAVGFASNVATCTGSLAPAWDQQVKYGAASDPNAENNIPISLLELHQDKANPGLPFPLLATGFKADYNSAFTTVGVVGNNNIYASGALSPYTRPLAVQKYIAGHADPTNFYTGGSYLVGASTGAVSNFYYSIDYRIKPGLPATFPNSGDNSLVPVTHALDNVANAGAGHYAQSGVYTMNVKYVLMEN